MKISVQIFIVLLLISFLIGLAVGTPLGMQKGQYMLFEGLNKAFDGANVEVNIDLNETQIVEETMEFIIPLLNQTINKQEVEK